METPGPIMMRTVMESLIRRRCARSFPTASSTIVVTNVGMRMDVKLVSMRQICEGDLRDGLEEGRILSRTVPCEIGDVRRCRLLYIPTISFLCEVSPKVIITVLRLFAHCISSSSHSLPDYLSQAATTSPFKQCTYVRNNNAAASLLELYNRTHHKILVSRTDPRYEEVRLSPMHYHTLYTGIS
jgi:hypothetical protein